MKIEELTTKLYEEGIAKAHTQEQEIIAGARKEAERIVAEARRAADELRAAAVADGKESRRKLEAELKLAGEQALAVWRSRISDLLVDAVLPDSAHKAVEDREFMEGLLSEVVAKWDSSKTAIDIVAMLPEDRAEETRKHFAAKSKALLDSGLTVEAMPGLKNGFEIRAKDGGYRISFSEDDFVSFFRGFLRENTRKLLFPTEATR